MEHLAGLGTMSFRPEPSRLATSDGSNWSQRSRKVQSRGGIPAGGVDSEDDTGTAHVFLLFDRPHFSPPRIALIRAIHLSVCRFSTTVLTFIPRRR
jgi:hypothetical protein